MSCDTESVAIKFQTDRWHSKPLSDRLLAPKMGGWPDHVNATPLQAHDAEKYQWKVIKSIENQSSDVTLKFTENITLRSGYSKKMLDLVQHNWHIPQQHAADLTIEKIFTATLKHQFFLDESYGGCKLDTYQEDWTEEWEVKYEIVIDIQAGKCVHNLCSG